MVVVILLMSSSDIDLFFFQAEDGIRDDLVTGVQTCALPICLFRLIERAVLGALMTIVAVVLERRIRARRRDRKSVVKGKSVRPAGRSTIKETREETPKYAESPQSHPSYMTTVRILLVPSRTS